MNLSLPVQVRAYVGTYMVHIWYCVLCTGYIPSAEVLGGECFFSVQALWPCPPVLINSWISTGCPCGYFQCFLYLYVLVSPFKHRITFMFSSPVLTDGLLWNLPLHVVLECHVFILIRRIHHVHSVWILASINSSSSVDTILYIHWSRVHVKTPY